MTAQPSPSGMWLPFLLQTTDPLFPTGSYAHSFGLEEVVALGIVHDPESLEAYLVNQVLPALQYRDLPYLRFIYTAITQGHLADLESLEAEIHAWKTCYETRQASIQQGIQRLRILHQTYENPQFKQLTKMIQEKRIHGHHLTIFGAQCAIHSIPLEATLIAWLYQSLAGHCTAALKLIRIGQTGYQRILRICLEQGEWIVHQSMAIDREDAGWFGPLSDIAAARHEFAPSRLFIS